MDFILPLLVFFGIIAVGGYGFYKHAVKHTDGTDDIQTADTEQKGLMSSVQAGKVGEIDGIKTDLDVAEAKLATIETNAKDDQTGAEIKALLEALSGVDRLVAAAIQHLDNLGVTPSAAQWGYLGDSSGIDLFVDRGDPVVADFTMEDLTTDGTWRDLDLSSIVPDGATAVLVEVTLNDDAVGKTFKLRKDANTNIVNTLRQYTQVANQSIIFSGIVSITAARVVEYYGSDTTWTSVTISIRGWWI